MYHLIRIDIILGLPPADLGNSSTHLMALNMPLINPVFDSSTLPPVERAPELRDTAPSRPSEPITSPESNPEEHSLKNFFSNVLVKWTTASSALVNGISAPIHLFDDNNPLKKIINHVSMLFTKVHLGAYSVAGLISAFEQKNPFLVFSFLTEGVAAFLGLRSIYLFRGIATGIDGAVAGIKDKYKKSNFDSYYESFNHSVNAIKDSFKGIVRRFSHGDFSVDGSDIAIFASLTAALGGIFGMTINERIGGAIRDIAGGIGDIGIFKLNNSIAKSSGFAYLGGTILDLAARVFNKGIASVLKVNNIDAFERLRDAFHESAIAFDRIGQYLFLKYNQQDDHSLKSITRESEHSVLPNPITDIHKKLFSANRSNALAA